MRKDKEKANILRNSGKSYSEIKSLLGVPRSTLSDWFRDQKWSNEIAKRCVRIASQRGAVRLVVLNTIRGVRLKRMYDLARQEAILDFEALKYHPLFLAGLFIYWREGDRTSKYRVSISSTDPNVIKIFKSFLDRICGLKNIKSWLLLYPDLNEQECLNFWMTKCGLKQEQFTKSSRISGRNAVKKISFGVCNIGVSSAYLKNKILKWIDLMVEEIVDEKFMDMRDEFMERV